MNKLRRFLGIIWILIGVYAGYYLIVNQALDMWKAGLVDADKIDQLVPAIIYTFILTPIIVGGMFIFGKYAFQGEFDRD